MGLKIDHLDETSAHGTLDGCLPFEARRTDASLTIRIADWEDHLPADDLEGHSAMRYAAYQGVARYRTHRRQAMSRTA